MSKSWREPFPYFNEMTLLSLGPGRGPHLPTHKRGVLNRDPSPFPKEPHRTAPNSPTTRQMRHSAHQAFRAIRNVLYGATMSDCAAERRQQLLSVCCPRRKVSLRKEPAICVVRGAISPDRQHHLGKPRSRMDQRTLARDLRNMVFADTAAGQGEMSVAKLKHVSITIVVACAAVMEIRFIVIFDWRSGSTQYDAMCCSLPGLEVLIMHLPALSPTKLDFEAIFEAIDCSW